MYWNVVRQVFIRSVKLAEHLVSPIDARTWLVRERPRAHTAYSGSLPDQRNPPHLKRVITYLTMVSVDEVDEMSQRNLSQSLAGLDSRSGM